MSGQPTRYLGTLLTFGDRATISAGLTRYLAAAGGTALASELAVVVPLDSTLRTLSWSAAASGLTGASNRVTVHVNAAPTPLEVTWNGAVLSGANSTTDVHVSPGDRVSVRIQLAAGGTSITRPRVSVELVLDSTSPWLADDPAASDSNFYHLGAGNIGIGTDSPGERLSVVGAISGYGIVPIGAIVAWHKSLPGTPTLPAGWVVCDGQILQDIESPYHNGHIPNLNGVLNSRQFLRGGATSGLCEEDAFQGHRVSSTLGVYAAQYGAGDTYVGPSRVWNLATLISNVVSDGIHGEPRMADETRPRNMSVVWIMRVK